MSIIDTNQLDDSVSNNEEAIPDSSNNPTVETPVNAEGEKKDQMIVMDGPLSTIYTQALNLVYNKETPEDDLSVSQESSANDVSIVAAVMNNISESEKDRIFGSDDKDTCYVYVTDQGKLEETTIDAFDSINVALGQESFKEIIVCIECVEGGLITNNAGKMLTYLDSRKVSTFTNRAKMIKYLGSKYK